MESHNIHIPEHFKNLSFAEFERYHKRHFSHDSMTARDRFEFIGGKVPKSKKSTEQPPSQFMHEL